MIDVKSRYLPNEIDRLNWFTYQKLGGVIRNPSPIYEYGEVNVLFIRVLFLLKRGGRWCWCTVLQSAMLTQCKIKLVSYFELSDNNWYTRYLIARATWKKTGNTFQLVVCLTPTVRHRNSLFFRVLHLSAGKMMDRLVLPMHSSTAHEEIIRKAYRLVCCAIEIMD